jgi:small-conductance mechanosensitive channel
MTEWPVVNRLISTALTTGGAVAVGLLINFVVVRRLAGLTRYTRGGWDDVLIAELRRRVPFWSLLVGVWLSLVYWPLTDRWLWFVSRAITALGVGSATLAAAATATRLVADYAAAASPGVPVPGLMRHVVRFVVITVGLLIILNGFGVEITPMLAALGVGGLAVALALQDPLANLFAGLFVTLAGQLRIGDYVRLDLGVEGTITDFNWHSTRVQSAAGDFIIVPNARIAKAVVTNFSLATSEVTFLVELAVAPGNELARVEEITLDIAKEVQRTAEGAAPGFEPVFRVQAFTEVGIRIAVVMRARTFTDQALVRHQLLKSLDRRYREAGIDLAKAAISVRQS